MSCLFTTIFLSLLFTKVCCILSGIKAANSEFPSVVLVKFNDSFYCGGSIILPKYVLTSGVCGYIKERMDGIGIHFVDLFVPGTGKIIPFVDVVVHPSFKISNTTAVHDIAIVKLRDPLEFNSILTATPIYEKRPMNGTVCKTAGWGMVNPKILTDEAVERPWPDENILRKCGEIVVGIENCQQLIDEDDEVKLDSGTHVCARGMEVQQGPSLGDFGGPLICEGQQAAIATHSLYNPKDEYLYTVYTPIYDNEAWIREVVGSDANEAEDEVTKYGKLFTQPGGGFHHADGRELDTRGDFHGGVKTNSWISCYLIFITSIICINV